MDRAGITMTFVDFECKNCGRKEEVKYDFLKDIKKEEKCCDCGHMMVRDYSSSSVGMHFHGTGFFNTSYKGK